MGAHMKTTIEISDALLEEARKVAAARSTTVRSLVEAGLRRELATWKRAPSFRLRDASFEGRGLRQDVAESSWERIRELAYESHGG